MNMKNRVWLLLVCIALLTTAAFAHEGAHILGTVTKVTKDAVTVEQRNKSVVTVAVPAGATFTRNDAAAKFADVKIGDRIAISATEANGKLIAETVRFISTPSAK